MSYTPDVPPVFNDADEASAWFLEQLRKIAAEFSETTVIELRPIGAAPLKPRAGMIVSADGVGWNPGAGAGAYEYKGGAWVKL